MKKRSKRSRRQTTPAARPRLSDDLRRTFDSRWRELTAGRYSPSRKIPDGVIFSLATLQPARGQPDPDVILTVRRQQGTGCDQKAEIAGWYSHQLQGAPCIGQAAVLAKLNAAAAALCCNTLKCPQECPCTYHPRQQLAKYRCTAQVEEGFLLQGQRIWNCECLKVSG